MRESDLVILTAGFRILLKATAGCGLMNTSDSQVTGYEQCRTATHTRRNQNKHSEWGGMVRLSKNGGLKKPLFIADDLILLAYICYSQILSHTLRTCRRDLLRGPVPQCVLVFCIEILVAGNAFLIPATSPTNRPLAVRGHGTSSAYHFYENKSYMILPSKHCQWVIS